MSIEKYLKLARAAREEYNAEDAAKYYDIVRVEDPSNAEAKFFYLYYKMFSGTQGEAYGNYVTLSNGIGATLKLVLESNDSEDEKLTFIKTMLVSLDNAKEAAYKANSAIEGGHLFDIYKIYKASGDEIYNFASKNLTLDGEFYELYYNIREELTLLAPYPLQALYLLGDEIVAQHNSNPEVRAIGIEIWKKAIKKQQGGASHAGLCNGFVKKYAEMIRKYEPDYVIPKASGCLG